MKRTLSLLVAFCCSLLCGDISYGQMINGNVFLKSKWLEAGVGHNGSLGSGTAPAGYHPHTDAASNNIGVLYDFGHDGWTVGSPPFYGDFTAARTPFEGWAIQVNGARSDAFYTTDSPYTGTQFFDQLPGISSLTGANVSYTNTGAAVVAVWQGGTTGSSGGLVITQTMHIDSGASWIVNRVAMVNRGNAMLPDVYYWRTFDPDNDAAEPGGQYSTTNNIVQQNDALHRVNVSATSPNSHPDAYSSLVAKDCRAKAMMYTLWNPRPASGAGNTLDKIYNGTATGLGSTWYTLGGTVPTDYDNAIGIIYSLGNIAAGDSAVLYYGYAFNNVTGVDSAFPESVINGDSSLCVGGVLRLTDPAGVGTWSSNNAAVATVDAATGVVNGIATGIALVTYSIGGCRADLVKTVTVKIPPDTISGAATVCTGANSQLSDAVPGGAWSSSNDHIASVNANGVVHGVADGAVNITYTMTPNCFVVKNIIVYHQPPMIVGSMTVCSGQVTMLSNAVSGGAWSSAAIGIATVSNTGAVSGVAGGLSVISYTIGGVCAATSTVTVLALADAGVITGLSAVCVGETITLSDLVSGGTWHGSNLLAGVAGNIVTGVAPGADTISYVVRNTCGSDTALKVVVINAQPDAGVISGDTGVCVGAQITLNKTAGGGVWSSSNATATVSASGVVTGLAPGVTVINYVVTNNCGAAAAAHQLTVYALPPPGSISGQMHMCTGGVSTLSETAPGGTWSSSDSDVVKIMDNIAGQAHALDAGVAIISYTVGPNGMGCYGVAVHSVTVTAGPTFAIDSVVTNIHCNGSNDGAITVTLAGSEGAIGYLWSNGGSNATINGLAPGQYILNISELATQCYAYVNFVLHQPDLLQVNAVAEPDKCWTSTGSITASAIGGVAPYRYIWTGGATGSELHGLTTGYHALTVTDTNGCVASATIHVGEDTCAVTAYDVVTPNGDGINDVWVIEGIQAYPGNTVQIFNKWGDLVYEKTGYNNDWSGKGNNDAPLPDGTYFYIIKLNGNNSNGGGNTFTGSVLIKR